MRQLRETDTEGGKALCTMGSGSGSITTSASIAKLVSSDVEEYKWYFILLHLNTIYTLPFHVIIDCRKNGEREN